MAAILDMDVIQIVHRKKYSQTKITISSDYSRNVQHYNNRSWGLFRPRWNITRHYLLIG